MRAGPDMRSSNFRGDDRGSAALIFALLLVPMLGAAGAAVDYGLGISTRNALQRALDAAVLSASRVDVAQENRETVFKSVFADNYNASRHTAPKTLTYSYVSGSGGKGEASTAVKTVFMGLLGYREMPVTVKSSANTDPINLEIVFALDISGSMQATDMGGGTRLAALKSSANKLIDTIMANKSAAQTVKFAVVPFNMAVNIGTANAGLVSGTANPLFAGSTWGGCVLERRGNNFATDTYNAGATDGSGRWQAYIWPPAPNSAGNSCLNPSNGTNTGYQSTEPAPLGRNPWRDGPNFNCPRFPMTRLSMNDSDARNAINGLEAWGNMGTTIGPAVGWGFRLLSPTGPFADGAGFSAGVRKILVVVTDGELVTDGSTYCSGQSNTASAYRFDPASLQLDGRVLTSGPVNDSFTPYGFLLDSDPYNRGLATALDADKELDRLAVASCDAVKARDTSNPIEIFTIAASAGAGPGTRAESVLTKCATSGEYFVYAADATALDNAFGKIGSKALRLRLTQ